MTPSANYATAGKVTWHVKDQFYHSRLLSAFPLPKYSAIPRTQLMQEGERRQGGTELQDILWPTEHSDTPLPSSCGPILTVSKKYFDVRNEVTKLITSLNCGRERTRAN